MNDRIRTPEPENVKRRANLYVKEERCIQEEGRHPKKSVKQANHRTRFLVPQFCGRQPQSVCVIYFRSIVNLM